MENELSIVRLVLNASPVVQVVMGLLLLASLMSWTIIFRKRSLLSKAHDEAENFENSFWKGGDLTALYRQIEGRGGATGMSSIFEFGFREFARLKQGGIPPDQLLEGARRAMRVGQLKELERLEESLSNLATIGSTSPYVGLFGTVWGIMSSFVALGGVQQATLAMVAPGIAEALIATAIGLFAAIPAVIAYNRYADQVSRLELRYDAFMDEFSTILQRYAGTRRGVRSDPWLPPTQKGRRRRLMGEINVVPYIDVMLVLLIIFMITAPLLTEGVKVDLPKAGARPIPPEMMKDTKPDHPEHQREWSAVPQLQQARGRAAERGGGGSASRGRAASRARDGGAGAR